jgi:3-methylfumaryl-CoA hydratase
LFRYSALTFNSHRIHYDRPYATRVEGYEDLVVQAPLIATLLAEGARRHSASAVRTIEFRARAPLFAGRPIWLTGTPEDGATSLAAVRHDHVAAVSARVEFASD